MFAVATRVSLSKLPSFDSPTKPAHLNPPRPNSKLQSSHSFPSPIHRIHSYHIPQSIRLSVVVNSHRMVPTMLSIKSRWYRFFLPRWVEKTRHPGLGHFTLPPEIILTIGTYLDKIAVMSLALTCRTLYQLCFPQSLTLSLQEREEFLLHLEKDTPDVYFCHYCISLHPWYRSWFRIYHGFHDKNLCLEMPCNKQPSLRLPLPYAPWNVDYRFARVVMNAHFYGDAHGVPVEKLSGSLRLHRNRKNDVRFSGTWCARIINHQLMLRSSFTAFQCRGDANRLRCFLDQRGPWICNHLHCMPSAWNALRSVLPELDRGTLPPDYFEACVSSVNSCAICMTDYCIDIVRGCGTKGWVVKIVTYQQLGSVRSPFDWSWKVMTDKCQQKERRLLHAAGDPPGIVRHRWSKSDALTMPPEGEFINIQ